MSLSSTSIERPVLATVISIVIILFGAIGYTYLSALYLPLVPMVEVRLRLNSKLGPTWKLPLMMSAIRSLKHKEDFLPTLTRPLFPNQMPMQGL